ncbi:Sec-independent protein translocase subunit TatA/TatB [Foetidibacter luteolus]|uniref:Sec-independent protein translocase subunit TatA/TatB n=1 Tax=Foetidibacter luteolus TaxID=2608880 RepID=UPI00129B9B46|nr:twin-arginine translocase TatA/TatE family subunit [Foetidibacter luteolus]
MGSFGFQEILIIALVILVLFGARKIPEFMKGIGKGIREFNDARDTDTKKEEEKKKDTKAAE